LIVRGFAEKVNAFNVIPADGSGIIPARNGFKLEKSSNFPYLSGQTRM